ncbi:hypothetical protein [Fibrella forsythiae]|uniref:Uncharacterized protein n=1 Tax=Fibrella forsythiae TaxID=2817061 RepID=A0ABS3JTC7_9BACT|nr:hypothetical protein [Fibrella forsythiae]MBO0953268.1 hypothetical protein [Fibrella forsythiae]
MINIALYISIALAATIIIAALAVVADILLDKIKDIGFYKKVFQTLLLYPLLDSIVSIESSKGYNNDAISSNKNSNKSTRTDIIYKHNSVYKHLSKYNYRKNIKYKIAYQKHQTYQDRHRDIKKINDVSRYPFVALVTHLFASLVHVLQAFIGK